MQKKILCPETPDHHLETEAERSNNISLSATNGSPSVGGGQPLVAAAASLLLQNTEKHNILYICNNISLKESERILFKAHMLE